MLNFGCMQKWCLVSWGFTIVQKQIQDRGRTFELHSKVLGRNNTWRIMPGPGYVVTNSGDRFRPLRIGLWDPNQKWPKLWLIYGGDPYPVFKSWEPILQVRAR